MLLAQEIFAGFDECALRHQTHDFGSCHPQSTVLSTAAHLVKGNVQRSLVDIGDVHRHLCDAIFLDKPADGLGALQGAGQHDDVALLVALGLAGDGIALTLRTSFFAHVKCDGVGTSGRSGIQIIVHGDEEVACADSCTSCTGHTLVVRTCAKVGSLVLVAHLVGQGLIFACTAHGKVLALRFQGSSLIAIARNGQFVGNAFCQFACQFSTLLKGDTAHGNKREHISGTHTRVGTMVLAHVNQFSGLLHGLESGFDHCIGFAHKGHHSTVGGLSGIHIEQFYTLTAFNNIGYLAYHAFVTSLAEIGDTLYNLPYFCHNILICFTCFDLSCSHTDCHQRRNQWAKVYKLKKRSKKNPKILNNFFFCLYFGSSEIWSDAFALNVCDCSLIKVFL